MNQPAEPQEHRAVDSFDLDGKWCTPCSCGLRFVSSTPSHARARWQQHANKFETAPDKTPDAPRLRSCGCGCGEPLAARAGGLFRSGHDARFKSVLTRAHAAGQQVRHPSTDSLADPMDIADWLDQRRGGGDFWRSKVLAGHRPPPEPRPRSSKSAPDSPLRGVARVDALMEAMATRRPVPGDMGVVTLKSGQSCGARVVRRENDAALAVKLLDGPRIAEVIVVGDGRFEKRSGQ